MAEKVFLYLARRDRSAINVLAVFNGGECSPNRILDLSTLGLPADMLSKIQLQVDDNKMLWEPWMESADDYNALKKKLTKRGFRLVPNHFKGIAGSTRITVNTTVQQSMIRRGSLTNAVPRKVK